LGFGAGCGGCVVLACGAETGVTLGYWKVWDAACMSIENYASAAAELRPPALSHVFVVLSKNPCVSC
jgi:hypothetical protein